MNLNECTFIIFGASGNLASSKLFPALYALVKEKKIGNFAVIGAAWADVTIDEIFKSATAHIPNVDMAVLQQLKSRSSYVRVDFTHTVDFDRLYAHVQGVETRYNLAGNRIVYCATASEYFSSITEYCAKSGLVQKTSPSANPWHRIVYEKPFGRDLASAHAINICIASHFQEHQIYRVDHYLTKEVVGNIALIRFTNCVFEPLWNNRYIDNVQIVVSEQVGTGGRGGYYDKYGALKDMVQNHMLELVALIGMETPEQLSGEYIRNERVRVIKNIEVVDALLGQYEGYTAEQDVAAHSHTETFAQVYLRVNNRRWNGVPFYLKTGKHLKKKETVIHIKFKQVDCLLSKNCPSDSNYLTIRIGPKATFSLSLNAKKPGESEEVIPVSMDFCHSCTFGAITPEAYEVVLQEVLKGEQSISVRFDEIEAAWMVVDQIADMHLPVYTYKQNSDGPQEATVFDKKHGIRWRS